MRDRKPLTQRYAICVDNSEYPASLELHRVYRVLPDKDAEHDGDLRIVDESGEDYLHSAQCFVLVDLPPHRARTLSRSYGRAAQPVS